MAGSQFFSYTLYLRRKKSFLDNRDDTEATFSKSNSSNHLTMALGFFCVNVLVNKKSNLLKIIFENYILWHFCSFIGLFFPLILTAAQITDCLDNLFYLIRTDKGIYNFTSYVQDERRTRSQCLKKVLCFLGWICNMYSWAIKYIAVTQSTNP